MILQGLLKAFWEGNWYTGEYWRVSLSESIRYSDGIFLRRLKDQKKRNFLVIFGFIILIGNVKNLFFKLLFDYIVNINNTNIVY